MLKKLSYEKKWYALLAGLFLLGILAYRMAIGKTLEARQTIAIVEQQLTLGNHADAQIASYSQQLKMLSGKLSTSSTGQGFQNKVIATLTGHCKQHGLEITEVRQSFYKQQGDYLIEVSPVVVRGNYKNIVQAIYNIEQTDRSFQVEGVHFLKKKESRTRRPYLTACLYLQNIKAV